MEMLFDKVETKRAAFPLFLFHTILTALTLASLAFPLYFGMGVYCSVVEHIPLPVLSFRSVLYSYSISCFCSSFDSPLFFSVLARNDDVMF